MLTAIEFVAPLWSELVMFALAALVYLIFMHSIKVRGPSNKTRQLKEQPPLGGPKTKVPPSFPRREAVVKTPLEQKHGAVAAEMEELPKVYGPILQACKAGDAAGALHAMSQLPRESLVSLPPQVATKVLLSLGKSETFSEELMYQFMDLASNFSSRSFESAASEASRWRSISICRRLYNLAGLASVRKTERLVTLLVRGHSNDPDAMKQMIEDVLVEGSGVQLTRSLAESLIAQCTSAGNKASLKMLQERAERRSMVQDISRQAKLISSLGKEGKLQDALLIFDRLKASQSPLNAMAYNCLLDACIQCKNLPQALVFFREMKEQCLPDVISYNTIMKGYIADGNFNGARSMMSEMADNGLAPTVTSYHHLLVGFVHKGDCSGALELVHEMRACGISMSVVTCSMMLKSIGGRSQSQGLSKIVALINDSGVFMDDALFGCIVDACVRSANLKVLWDQLERVWRKDVAAVEISSATYGNMIKAYGQAHDVQKVKHLWSKQGEEQVKLTSITVGCMVEALVSNGLPRDAWAIVGQLWEDAETRKLVNTVTYSTIVKGFTVTRQHDQVLAIYKEMKDRQIQCNAITYNTMLNACTRCNMLHEIPQLLIDMKESTPPIEPDIVTFSTIIKGYCMSGDFEKALKILAHMKAKTSVQPDEVLYNSLLNGCAKEQRVDQALELLEEMMESGISPSNFTLSIICKLLGRAKRLDEAFSMVESISNSHGFRPNIEVNTCLMHACFQSRQCHRALALHDKVVREGYCSPDQKTYNVIVRGCLYLRATDKATQVVRCAFHLPGHKMQQTQGPPQGVEIACIEEVMADLGHTSQSGKALINDLKEICGIIIPEASSISSQAPRRRHDPHACRRL